jgi:hypothetical protein
MSIPYPNKPWNDGQSFQYIANDGTQVIGTYNASKNAWTFARAREDGGGASGIITTANVVTLNSRPTDINNPFSLSSDPSDVVNQQEANWWLYEHLGARPPIFDNTPPSYHPGYTGSDQELVAGDVWVDTSVTGQFSVSIWDGYKWVPIAVGNRPPIFSDTEPTIHPDFSGTQAELVPGDIWFDTTDPFQLIQYVWNGTGWIEAGANVFTTDVKTIAITNPRVQQSPKALPDLKTQYEVNWFVMSAIEKTVAVIAFLQSQLNGFPDIIVGPNAPNNDNGALNFWYDTTGDVLYFWDPLTEQWHAVQYPRPPIFSDTEPTEHPHVPDPKDLIIGDIWIDTTDNPVLIDYIWDGNQWVNVEDRYVHSKGGDAMEGPLIISGDRDAGVSPPSTLVALNVDSGENSDLQLRHNGDAKVYVGKDQTTIGNKLHLNSDEIRYKQNGTNFVSDETDRATLTLNKNGIFYRGDITTNEHLITKEYSDLADEILDAKVSELRVEVDALAPVDAAGVYRWQDVSSLRPPAQGQFLLLSEDLTTTVQQYGQSGGVWIHQTDWNGNQLDFTNVHVGELIQLFDRYEPEWVQGEITEIQDSNLMPDYSGSMIIKYDRIVSNGGPDYGSGADPLVNFKVYRKPTDDGTGADAFLPTKGGEMFGNIQMGDNKIRFDVDGENGDHLHFTRNDGEYARILRLDHPGAQVHGGYDIRLGGNTNYSQLRLMGGSNGDEVCAQMRANGRLEINKPLFLEDVKITGLAHATDDADAVNLGQVREGLTELRDEFLKDLIVGTWYSDNFNSLVTAATDRFVTVRDNGTRPDKWSEVAIIRFHETDNNGSQVQWDHWDPGEIVTFRATEDPGVTATFRLLTAVNINGETRSFTVEFLNAQNDSNSVFTYFTQYAVTLTEFSDGFNGSDLDALYLRLDASNDPIKDELNISTGDQTGAAALVLTGRRSGTTNNTGTIAFKNSLHPGYTGYFGWKTDDNDRWFTFSSNIDLNSNAIHNCTYVRFPHSLPFQIESKDGATIHKRLAFTFPSNANEGNAAIQFDRYPTNVRRGFAFKGRRYDNDGSLAMGDLLWSYLNNTGEADAVNYQGKTNSAQNIQTKASVEALIADAYVIDEEGDLHFNDHRLEDVGVCVAATDAATKGYVDTVTSQTWTYVAGGASPPADGTFTWNPENNTFYISGVTREGVALTDNSSSFNEYSLVAPASMYDKTDGGALRVFFKTSSFRVQSYGGKDYFRVVRGGYAKQQLTENHNYTINIAGLFQ